MLGSDRPRTLARCARAGLGRRPGRLAGPGRVGFGLPVLAEPVSLDGLTFSDELGGFDIVGASGSGSLEDPFVVVEEITADGPAILTIRGMSHRFGNRIRSHHEIGFALTKILRNRTKRPWSFFNLELREFLDHASPFGDGLSFGQASEAGRPFRSDRFTDTLDTTEPFDGVQFLGAEVGADETVVVNVVITDTTPRWEFYLLQTRGQPAGGAGAAQDHQLMRPVPPYPVAQKTPDQRVSMTVECRPPAAARHGRPASRAGRQRGVKTVACRGSSCYDRAALDCAERSGMKPSFHEDFGRHDEVRSGTDRSFGLTVGGILLVIAAARSYFHGVGWVQYGLAAVGLT